MVTKPYFVILNEVKNLLRMQEIKLIFSNKLRDSSGFTLRMTVLKPSQFILMENFFKENWFKLIIILVILILSIFYLFLDRFYFMHLDGNTI
ncbi:MAG: hypothetical protein HY813_00145 [Candidatus Portnoybacteria bacterium]|nr:hypothetical protein [Candidatus Portnoybacteria bacterium]